MKKILLALSVFAYTEIMTQEVLDSFPADIDTKVIVEEPLEVAEPIVVVEEVGTACEYKGFFCKFFEAIKSFFMNFIKKIKNLFSSSTESKVEMVIETEDGDVVNAEMLPTDQIVVYENIEEDPELEELEQSQNNDLKLSNAKRKDLSQEPFWLQQRS